MKDNKLRVRLLREWNLMLEKEIECCKTAEIVESQNQAWEHSSAQLNVVWKKNMNQRAHQRKRMPVLWTKTYLKNVPS